MAAIWRLLPNRVSGAPTRGIGEVDAATIRMHPLAYCDNNFVITAHDAPEEYKIHLRELASGGKVKFVLSPWHWREMARDADHARGTSVADFSDSLDPVWLYDRRTIQKKEVLSAFFKFANLPTAQPVMLGDIGDIIYDLAGTSLPRSTSVWGSTGVAPGAWSIFFSLRAAEKWWNACFSPP